MIQSLAKRSAGCRSREGPRSSGLRPPRCPVRPRLARSPRGRRRCRRHRCSRLPHHRCPERLVRTEPQGEARPHRAVLPEAVRRPIRAAGSRGWNTPPRQRGAWILQCRHRRHQSLRRAAQTRGRAAHRAAHEIRAMVAPRPDGVQSAGRCPPRPG